MHFLAQDDFFSQLIQTDLIIPVVAIVGGISVAIVAILRSMVVAKAREQTKREIAAYVAEGSIDADKAIAMIGAEADPPQKCSFR